MSNRYTFTVVFAIDKVGKRYPVYNCDHYAGGCEYKSLITVEGQQYEICGYPLEDLVETSGDKLPQLSVADLQSYFTDAPTEAIRQVLTLCTLDDLEFPQLVMVVEHAVESGMYETECISVTADGTEHTLYGEQDVAGDDPWSIADNLADDAWFIYQHKNDMPQGR
jgi:hypothetical protein